MPAALQSREAEPSAGREFPSEGTIRRPRGVVRAEPHSQQAPHTPLSCWPELFSYIFFAVFVEYGFMLLIPYFFEVDKLTFDILPTQRKSELHRLCFLFTCVWVVIN